MKIGIASDIHFEFYRNEPNWLPPLPVDCDIMVLAGDISVGDKTIDDVIKVSNAMPNTQIVWVAGNHEFYKTSIEKQINKFKTAFADHKKIHFLENGKVEIDGYLFLGCTLWTGFDCLGDDRRQEVLNASLEGLNDFRMIRQSMHTKPFRPHDAMMRYFESRLCLESELTISDPDKTIVVTHFPPSRSLRHGVIPEDWPTAYFQANCDDLIEEYQPALWLYGHNHWSDDCQFNNTRVVSNQLGYPGETISNERYTTNKILI